MGQSDSESTSSSMRGNPGSPRDISGLFDEPNGDVASVHSIFPISPSMSTSSSEVSDLDNSVTVINQTPKRSEIPVIDLTTPDEGSTQPAESSGGAVGGPPCEDFAQFASNFRWRLHALEERIANRDLRDQRARLLESRLRCRRYRSRHTPYTGLWDGDASTSARHDNLHRSGRSAGVAPPTNNSGLIVIDDEHSPYVHHQAHPSDAASRFPSDSIDPIALGSGSDRLRRQIHVDNSRRFREARVALDRIQPVPPRCFLQSDEALAHRLQQAEYNREIEEQQRMRESSMHHSTPNVGVPPMPAPMPVRRRRPIHAQFANQGVPDLLLPFVSVSVSLPPPLHHYGDSGPGHTTEGEDYEALWNLSERIGLAKARGLSKEVIDCIPSFRYSASSKDSSNGSCVVCMSDYSNREKLRRLPCHHDFHAKCIDRWLKNNRTCPVCREQVAQS